MKQFDLKETEIPNDIGKATYADLVRMAINRQPRDTVGNLLGFDPEDMRIRLKILNSLDNVDDDVLLLEDDHANKLKACVKSMRWPFQHQALLDFTDDVALKIREVENGSAKDGD